MPTIQANDCSPNLITNFLISFPQTYIDRKDPCSTPSLLMAQFNLEPKVTFFAESSTSSGIANDKEEDDNDNLHNE